LASAASLTFADNTFTSEAAGADRYLEVFAGGSFGNLYRNGVLCLYDGTQPTNSDDTESGSTLVAIITKNGGSFTSGISTNGLNMDTFTNGYLKRAIDPATGNIEIWKGPGLVNGTARWGRFHSNAVVFGASTSAVRMDGLVSTQSTGDIVLGGSRDIFAGADATVTDVAFNFHG